MAQSFAPEQGSPPPNDQLSAVRPVFPRTQAEFDSDPRVSFSKLDNKYILEEDDGQEFEWNESVKKWTPVYDDALREQQQRAYATEESQAEQERIPTEQDGEDDRIATHISGTKRKSDDQDAARPKKVKKSTQEKPVQEKQNTAVYVTSIPLDADEDEIASVFGKCGVIAEATDNSSKRIKMYKDEHGKFRGEALVIFFRRESVSLAIHLLDDSDFRLGVKGPGGPMRVTEADRSFKKTKDDQDEAGRKESQPGPRRPKGDPRSRGQIKEKTQKMNDKLADWSSDEDPQEITPKNPVLESVLVLYHMFTLIELEDDPAAKDDIREEIKEEAEKVGPVVSVKLFDSDPRGVVTIKFENRNAARQCMKLMDGRQFEGRSVIATIADGTEQFKESRPKAKAADTNEQESKRINEFGEWLEKGKEA